MFTDRVTRIADPKKICFKLAIVAAEKMCRFREGHAASI